MNCKLLLFTVAALCVLASAHSTSHESEVKSRSQGFFSAATHMFHDNKHFSQHARTMFAAKQAAKRFGLPSQYRKLVAKAVAGAMGKGKAALSKITRHFTRRFKLGLVQGKSEGWFSAHIRRVIARVKAIKARAAALAKAAARKAHMPRRFYNRLQRAVKAALAAAERARAHAKRILNAKRFARFGMVENKKFRHFLRFGRRAMAAAKQAAKRFRLPSEYRELVAKAVADAMAKRNAALSKIIRRFKFGLVQGKSEGWFSAHIRRVTARVKAIKARAAAFAEAAARKAHMPHRFYNRLQRAVKAALAAAERDRAHAKRARRPRRARRSRRFGM